MEFEAPIKRQGRFWGRQRFAKILSMILGKMISFCKYFEENVIVFLFAKILRMVLREIFCKDFEENASRQPWQFHLGSQKQSPRRRAEKMQNQSPDSFILVTKKTKYILPPQILVHREVFNWSPLRFLNAPPRFHFGTENGEAQLGNHPVCAIFSSPSHPNFQLESNWISVKVKLHTISAWPLIRGTWDLSWRPGTKQL